MSHHQPTSPTSEVFCFPPSFFPYISLPYWFLFLFHVRSHCIPEVVFFCLFFCFCFLGWLRGRGKFTTLDLCQNFFLLAFEPVKAVGQPNLTSIHLFKWFIFLFVFLWYIEHGVSDPACLFTLFVYIVIVRLPLGWLWWVMMTFSCHFFQPTRLFPPLSQKPETLSQAGKECGLVYF